MKASLRAWIKPDKETEAREGGIRVLYGPPPMSQPYFILPVTILARSAAVDLSSIASLIANYSLRWNTLFLGDSPIMAGFYQWGTATGTVQTFYVTWTKCEVATELDATTFSDLKELYLKIRQNEIVPYAGNDIPRILKELRQCIRDLRDDMNKRRLPVGRKWLIRKLNGLLISSAPQPGPQSDPTA